MARSGDHYTFFQLILDLKKVGLEKEAEKLQDMDRQVEEILDKRRKMAHQILKENLTALTPILRPCHKRQGTDLKVYTWY